MRRFQWLLAAACGLGLLGVGLTRLPLSTATAADNPQAQQEKEKQDRAKQDQEKAKQDQAKLDQERQMREKQAQEKQAQTQQQTQEKQKSQQAHQTAERAQESRDLSYGMNAAGQIRANKFVGTEVRSRDDEKLGDIEDIIFDLKNGRVLYVAISAGGFLGIGSKLVAVPWNSLQIHGGAGESSSDRFVVLNVSKDEFRNAPNFASDAWPTAQDQIWQVGTEHEEMDHSVERQHEKR